MSEEKVYEEALLGIASCATKCPCCAMHRAIAEKALGLNAGGVGRISGIPTLMPVGSETYDHRTSQEGRDAPGSGEAGELAHYPV